MLQIIKKLLKGSSLTLAIIYTLGHICIAMTIVTLMTGASFFEAGAVGFDRTHSKWYMVLYIT